MSDFLKTTNSQVSLPFSGDLDVSITIPKVRPSKLEVNKTAISIYVSSEGSHNPIGCYIYSVPNIYSTILNNSNESLLDITKKLSNFISKRYSSPSYVNINGSFGIEEITPMITTIIGEIEKGYDETE